MKAELISHLGTDDTVVDAARVSFSKQAANYTPEQNGRLIHYLARHNHFTPFTHPQITLREKVPIFVARQRFKHVVGFSYNEESRRYVDDTPEFFVPEEWRSRPQANIKQGSGNEAIKDIHRYVRVGSNLHRTKELMNLADEYDWALHEAARLYFDMLEGGVAPEQARMILPQSMYTSYYVTGSLAAWARAFKQRIDPHAQKEIQDLAKQWNTIIQPLFPVSWAALTEGETK